MNETNIFAFNVLCLSFFLDIFLARVSNLIVSYLKLWQRKGDKNILSDFPTG